jgi:hypothetical protein
MSNDPWSDMERWGRKLAEEQGLRVKSVDYDSDILSFVVSDQPKLNVALKRLHEAAVASDFIKLPYKVGDLQLFDDSMEEDFEVESGEIGFTIVFYIADRAR